MLQALQKQTNKILKSSPLKSSSVESHVTRAYVTQQLLQESRFIFAHSLNFWFLMR